MVTPAPVQVLGEAEESVRLSLFMPGHTEEFSGCEVS